MVFASASGSSRKPKPKPQTWSSELPTYLTVYVNKPASPTSERPIPNDIAAFVPPAPPAPAAQPRPSKPAGTGSRPPQPAPSDSRTDVGHQGRPDERRGSNRATQKQAESKPDYAPDAEEESETAAISAEKAWSYEDLFLSMDAVDLSYYSSLQEYDLVRDAAISLRHEKLILFHLDNPREYLKRFATYTWDEEADAAAEEFIQWYVERFRPELERQLDILTSGPAFGQAEEAIEDLTAGEEEDTLKDLTSGEAGDTIKRWQKDLTNDENEVVIAIDLITGETLFVRYGDEDSVTLHDEQKELVEDRYVALLHHHPNNSAASLADLDATKWLKGDFLLVTNPDGTLHRYVRVGETLIPLEPTHNPEYAAPVDPMETAAADAAYLAQTLLEMGNPPEMVMEQGELVPSASDYVTKRMFRLTFDPPINQDFARPWGAIDFSPLSPLISWYIGNSAESAQSHGLDNAGKMLLHWLGGSGERVAVNVDELINDVPGFGLHIMDTVGFDLGESPPMTENPEGRHNESIVYQSDRYSVAVYDHGWKQVGKGAKTQDNIYGADVSLPYGYDMFKDLRQGKAPDGIPQDTFDWYLAVNKFYYSPRVAVVLDKETEDVEVALVVNVRDHYAWYVNNETGIEDRIMARLEHGGYARNFPIHGQSSVITGRFNLKDLTSKNDKPYFQLRDVEFAANE